LTSTESSEIVEAEPLVSPADPKRVLEVMRRFEEFKRQALTPNDFVMLEIGKEKKPYIKKSGWMKYALACQLNLEKRDERVEEHPDGSKVFHYTYRAVAPNGRYADAVGSASSTEKVFTHPDHDVRALAQTRACNRAISNLVAGGEVSAEEMISDMKEQSAAQPQGKNLEIQSSEPSKPEDGSLDAITDEMLAAELEKLPWRPNKSGKEGWNVRWDDLAQRFRAKLGVKLNEANGKRYVILGGYSYRRYGDQNEWLARYATKATFDKGTKTTESVPTEVKQSPEQQTWRVSALKDFASPELLKQGLRQIPLGINLQSFGMVNILGDEIAICPERPIPKNSGSVETFLIERVLSPIAAKHKVSYQLKTSGDLLEAILIRGTLPEQQVKELSSAARWAFSKALSKDSQRNEKP
jgi:hypothetical protein